MPLWTYCALTGSIAVAVSGLISLLVPPPWGLPVWAVLGVAFCTGVGLLADRFVTSKERR